MDEATAATASAQHPVRLVVTDDLRRTRLTVFFRLLLAIPHFIWLELVGVVVILATIGNWFVTLFAGRSSAGPTSAGTILSSTWFISLQEAVCVQ